MPSIEFTDGTIAHITFSTKKNCWNMMASCYGTCYGCGCCSDNKTERYKSRIQLMKEMLEEQNNFSDWFDDPKWRETQEKNIRENIRYAKRRIRYYERRLKAETVT